MEGEINNFIMVWTTVIVSACYCYGVSKFVPKGGPRLMAILPVVCLFMVLPLNLNSVHLGCVTFFFISWIANFKLLQLSFGIGPLSDTSLQMAHFISLACLPIKVQKSPKTKPPPKVEKKDLTKTQYRKKMWRPLENEQKYKESSSPSTTKNGLKSVLHYFKKLLFLGFLLCVYSCREYVHPKVYMFIIVMYLYIGLELLLVLPGIIARALLGLELEQPFDQPYLSTSFQDFWGRRWNLISTDVLRLTVYNPIFHHTSRTLGPYWALIAAIMGSFFVSALMHELIFYHLCRVGPTWGSTLFFFVQGLCLVVEIGLKRKLNISRRLPRVITGPLIFTFMICMFVWLVMPIVVRFNIDTRVVEEYAALGELAMDLVLDWKEKCCYLLVNYLKLQSTSY